MFFAQEAIPNSENEMKIYTKTGDEGMTSLISGRVSKANPRIKAIGAVDSLNAQLGYLIEEFKTKYFRLVYGFDHTKHIQQLLFTLGSQLADTKGTLKIDSITEEDVTELEKEIDRMTLDLPPQELYSSTRTSSHFIDSCRKNDLSNCRKSLC